MDMLKNFYYDRLSSHQKKAYGELLCGMKSKKNEIVISSEPNLEIIQALSFEHSELYYVDLTDIPYKRGIFECRANVKYKNFSDGERIRISLNNIISNLQFDSTESIIRGIHNYFVKNIKYDSINLDASKNHNIIGPLINGKGVCEGISKAAQYILDSLKIDNTVVQGTLENEPHMWNVVSINGYNYHLDITSDISLTESKWDKPGYFYYLLTDNEIKKTHCFSEKFDCFQTSDNPFYKTNKMFYDDVSLINFIRTVTRNQRMIYFKYLGTKIPNEVLKLVADNVKLFNIFTRLNMKEKLGTYYIWY